MAVAAQNLSFYNDGGFFSQPPPICSNSTLMMNDNGTVSFGSLGATGQSLLSSFGDGPNFVSPWPELFATPFSSTSFFNSSIQSSVPLSEALYTSDDPTADLLLMGSDSEYLNQVSGVAAVMHPNLVSTLKNMVAPGPGSPRQGGGSISQISYHSFFEQQPSQNQAQGISIFTPCHQQDAGAEQKVGINADSPRTETTTSTTTTTSVGVDPPASSPICSQLLKVEKSETEDNIEAAVVSVDLIQNRRPFRCQHEGCNKTFKNPQTMKMHHKTHYTDGSAASKAGLLSLPTLSSSLKAGHNKKIPSRCPKCKKTFVGLYELRRHYGRKHSEGEKPFGCRKCGKKFYIEVDVRDHEKLCGEPIECKCGLKFAFKCNLVAHKKAHPACQDQTTISSTSSTTSSSTTTHQSSSSSSDSDHSRNSSNSSSSPNSTARGTRRQREEILSPMHPPSLHLPTPLPDFKDIPEAPQFKCARYDFSATDRISTPAWHQYPTVPTFSHLPTSPLYPSPQQSQHFAIKMQQHLEQQQGSSFGDMGLSFTTSHRLH